MPRVDSAGGYARRAALSPELGPRRWAGDAPLDSRDLYAVTRARDSERLADAGRPLVILAGSGMCTGRRILGHLQRLLPRATTPLRCVGHQAHGTLGRRLQQAAPNDALLIEGVPIPLRAHRATLHGLSAHADRTELLDWASHLPPTERLVLFHGEMAAQRALAEELGRG